MTGDAPVPRDVGHDIAEALSPRPAEVGAGSAWLAAVVCAVLAMGIFAITLGGDYVYDDFLIARDDPRLSDPAKFRDIVYENYIPNQADALWRPLLTIQFWAHKQIHGDRPAVLHAVNVLLYGLLTAGVVLLAARVAPAAYRKPAAWMAGALFAAHPVHVEPVAYLVGRSELLVAMGVVGSCLLVLRGIRMSTVMIVPLVVGLGLMVKESAVAIPGVLLVMVPMLMWQPAAGGERVLTVADLQNKRAVTQRALLLAFLICMAVVGVVVVREFVVRVKMSWDPELLEWWTNPLLRATGLDRAVLPFVVLGRAAQLLVAPWNNAIDYGGRTVGYQADYSDPYLYVGLVAGAAIVAAGVYAYVRRRAGLFFCVGGFVVTYGLVSHFVIPIGTVLGERLLLVPSIFVVLLAAMGLARMGRAGVAVAVVLVVCGAARSVWYAGQWRDAGTLYAAQCADHPRNVRVRALMADLRMREAMSARAQGREGDAARLFAESERYAREAIKLEEDNLAGVMVLSRTLRESGRPAEALREIESRLARRMYQDALLIPDRESLRAATRESATKPVP